MSSQMPSPPFPDPGSPVLKVIVTAAVDAVHSGEATVEQAILHAAVHGWYDPSWATTWPRASRRLAD